MQVICTTRAQFFNPANQIETVNKAGESIKQTDRSLHNAFTATPSQRPQIVPDWIVDDPLFAPLEADGKLIRVQVLTKAPAAPQAPTAPAASGWGAQPEGIGLGFQKPVQVPVTTATDNTL